MNKKGFLPLLIVIVAVIVIGGGGYAVYSHSKNTASSDNSGIDADADADTKVDVNLNGNLGITGNVPLGEWCVAGQTYNFASGTSTSDTTIEGIASYKGQDWCKGVSKTTIDIPNGYAGGKMEILTTYYFSYGAKEMWVVTNTNGQITETHITN